MLYWREPVSVIASGVRRLLMRLPDYIIAQFTVRQQ